MKVGIEEGVRSLMLAAREADVSRDREGAVVVGQAIAVCGLPGAATRRRQKTIVCATVQSIPTFMSRPPNYGPTGGALVQAC